jgi:peroxiredoxin Q/BCP
MRVLLAAAATLPLAAASLGAQEPPAAPPLAIGAVAPDFALPGGTRYGRLAEPVRLSDFKGKTVVLAFFFRARTKG